MVDASIVRKWVLDANDGIISTTGIMQGFAGAGANEQTVLFAAVAVMVTGGLSLGGAAYAEAAQDRAAELEVIKRERELIRMSPEQQVAELRTHYMERGLEPALAAQVADQLSAKDPLAAQLETEFGILEDAPPATRPLAVAARGVFGFISGALPLTFRVTWAVVVLSLMATGLVSARAGVGHPMRAVTRSILIGLFIGLLSFLAGNVFDLVDQFLPQIEVDVTELTPSPSP